MISLWSPFSFLANAYVLTTDITEIHRETQGLSWDFRAFHRPLAWEWGLLHKCLHLPLLLILNLGGYLGWNSYVAWRKIKVLHNCIKCLVVKKQVTNGEATCPPQHVDGVNIKMRCFIFQPRDGTGGFQDNTLWQRQACKYSSYCIPNLQQKDLE